ncbi:hypothetical protein HT031_005137 [Scenedesmus sp. PABB004]|nr:hypothetical protein HT031_005137 [Scenedesmus sp. PABB004]
MQPRDTPRCSGAARGALLLPQPPPPLDPWAAASALIAHPCPDVRLGAVGLLGVLAGGRGGPGAAPAEQQARLDGAFLALCSALATEPLTALRLEALGALSGLHRASLAVRLQALSKRATLRAAAPAGGGALLDSATGAFVHALEDDSAQVRLAAVAALMSLGRADRAFADAAAALLVDAAADELVPVRLAGLRGLVEWAAAFAQARAAAQAAAPGQAAQPQAPGQRGEQPPAPQKQQQCVEQQQQQQQQQHEQHEQQQCVEQQQGVALEEEREEGQLSQEEEEEEEEEGQWVLEAGAAPAEQAELPGAPPGQPRPGDARRGGGNGGGRRPQPPLQQGASGQQQQQQQKRRAAKRKADLPPWGVDALAAAVAALCDVNAPVRAEALRLAALLPPSGPPAVGSLLAALADCCERHPGQHLGGARAAAEAAVTARPALVAQAAPQLAKLLGRVAGAGAGAPGGGEGLALVQAAVLAAAAARPRMLPALLGHLERGGLCALPALAPLVVQLRAAAPPGDAACDDARGRAARGHEP